jgi:TolB-like protein/tetratricopeptide (TPR) repeat protein
MTPQPFSIETVPRVGHRLVEQPQPGAVEKAGPTGRRRSILIGAVVALLIAAAGLLFWQQRGAEAEPASIAVLPFRNLSAGEPYFAEGIGEEILGQLAREPQFRVAGRASSSEFRADSDFRDVARRLGVDYVLEGSVRTQRDQVRVNAGLIRASDGVRLWSDSYDGKLDDIFAIQQRIGGAIAGALRRRLVRDPVRSGPLVTSGQAYNFYLTARGLIRLRDSRLAVTASSLLRDAIELDPNYAPAWASLAEARYLEERPDSYEGFVEKIPEARRFAQHALRLAPDLPQGHRIMGMLLGYGTPEAAAHIRRAAQLDPNSAENMVALASVFNAQGQFEQELAALRRANELDPLWFRTVGALGIALSEMGDRAEAEAVTKRGFAGDIINQHILLGRIAWTLGDFSEAVRHWSIVVRSNSPRWERVAQVNRQHVLFGLGLRSQPGRDVALLSDQRRRGRVWMDAPPSASAWQAQNRHAIAADIYRDRNHLSAKLMLAAGRARELVATYDSPAGLLTIRQGQRLRVDQLHEAPVVALALRRAGRVPEADRLIREAETLARAVYRRTRVPIWFDADMAAIWAVQGKIDQALATLERAAGRGWVHTTNTALRDVAEEPVFQSLHGHARFDRLRARIAAHLAREREETERLPI